MKSRTDAKGQKAQYSYDAYGRKAMVQHFNSSQLEQTSQRVTYACGDSSGAPNSMGGVGSVFERDTGGARAVHLPLQLQLAGGTRGPDGTFPYTIQIAPTLCHWRRGQPSGNGETSRLSPCSSKAGASRDTIGARIRQELCQH